MSPKRVNPNLNKLNNQLQILNDNANEDIKVEKEIAKTFFSREKSRH